MKRISTTSGERFARWTVIDGSRAMAFCRCDCGVERHVDRYSLVSGLSKSCGCLKRDHDAIRHQNRRKAMPEYTAWNNMKTRCTNANYHQYKDYGARGIGICDRWLYSFENFLADMGRRPTPKHSIERNDNNKGYCPENCRWATRYEQGKNKRCNIRVTFNGVTRTVAEWSRHLRVRPITIYSRIYRGETNPALILGFA